MEHVETYDMLITLAVAVFAGVALIVIARRIFIPAIVLLLVGGIALGPEFLGVLQPDSLGPFFSVLVSLAVGLILFEGGLTLDISGHPIASSIIRRLLTVGVVTTWVATAVAIIVIFRFEPFFALLGASLVIVTGPTVIAPLLKRIKVTPNLHSILHWEGVLIDPIGVFIAILCFEYVSGLGGQAVLANFALRVLAGVLVGVAGGFLVVLLLKSRFVPEEMTNVFALACAVMIFGVTEAIGQRFDFSEAGLLSVVIAGFILGVMRPRELRRIREFKAEITDLLIGLLFMLLAARLEFDQFREFGVRGAVLVAIVIFVIRPINIAACSIGLNLNWREKLFLSWIAPRGIVAASMASLFTLNLAEREDLPDIRFLETFTYSVIVSTIILQGFTAGPVASLLKVRVTKPTGWMIVGAHPFGRRIAKFLAARGKYHTILVDLNPRLVADARAEGLAAIVADARDRTIEERPELQGIGNLLALTDNEDLNLVLCERWSDLIDKKRLYRWSSGKVEKGGDNELVGNAVWSNLPKPTLLSAELGRGEAVIVQAVNPPTESRRRLVPLLTLDDGAVIVSNGAKKEPSGEALYLRRETDYLTRSIRPELVLRTDAANMEELFKILVGRAAEVSPDIDRELTVRELLDRERMFPTALGHGVAVPHSYSASLGARLCVVAQVPGGINFDAPDGEPVKLVFLLLSPTGDPEGHLATLGEIARLAADHELRTQLINAEGPESVLNALRGI